MSEVNTIHIGGDAHGPRDHRAGLEHRRVAPPRRREVPAPGRPRARRAHASSGPRSCSPRARPAPASSASIPTTGAEGARAQRPLRSVRAARRARGGLEGEADRARRCSSRWTRTRSTSRRRSSCSRCRASSAPTPTATEITAQNGRYGPYLRKGTDSRSLESEDQIFNVTLEAGRGDLRPAEAAAAAAGEAADRRARPAAPTPEKPVRVLDGRFGPYVTDGTTNATVPRGMDPTRSRSRKRSSCSRSGRRKGPAKKKATAKPHRRRRPPRSRRSARKPPSTTTHGRRRAPAAKKAAATKAGHEEAADPRSRCPRMTDEQVPHHEAPFIPLVARSTRSRRRRGGSSGTRAFFRLWLAQVFSSLGDWVGFFAILADRRAGLRRLGGRVQPRHAGAHGAGLLPRHARRRDRRPLRPAQGDGVLRPRARVPCSSRCRSSRTSAAAVRLVRHRDPHAAVGAGEGRVGAALRARREARVGELAVARRVVRHVPARVDHLLGARRLARGSGRSTSSPRSRSTRRCSRCGSTR